MCFTILCAHVHTFDYTIFYAIYHQYDLHAAAITVHITLDGIPAAIVVT